jgi:hypothetical protein
MTTLRRKIIASTVTAGALSVGALGLTGTHSAFAHERDDHAHTTSTTRPAAGWKWRLSVVNGAVVVRPAAGWKWRL